jgi:hypothetical protein
MACIWLHPVQANVEAGNILMGATTSANKLITLADETTTVGVGVNNLKYTIGRAITGGSADGKYILWKLSI